MGKVDGGLLLLEISEDTAGLLVALAERAEGSDGLGLEAEGGGQLGPVNVGSSRLGDRHDGRERDDDDDDDQKDGNQKQIAMTPPLESNRNSTSRLPSLACEIRSDAIRPVPVCAKQTCCLCDYAFFCDALIGLGRRAIGQILHEVKVTTALSFQARQLLLPKQLKRLGGRKEFDERKSVLFPGELYRRRSNHNIEIEAVWSNVSQL